MGQNRFLTIVYSAGLSAVLLGACAAPALSPTAAAGPTPTPAVATTMPPTATITPDIPPTPPAGPTHLDLPPWAADPASTVLLATVLREGVEPSGSHADADYQAAVVNAATQERAPLPDFISTMVTWLPDGRHLAFLNGDDTSTLYVGDTTTGAIAAYPLSPAAAARIEGGLTRPYTASGSDPAAPGFIIAPSARVSGDGRYDILVDDDLHLIVEDLSTGDQLPLPLPENRYAGRLRFAPGQPLLAYMQYDQDPAFRPFEPTQRSLVIYDYAARQVLATYPDTEYLQWAPDGKELLYLSGAEPCLLAWETGDHHCIGLGPEVDQSALVDVFALSPHGRKLSYIYYHPTPVDGSGLCIKDLAAGGLICLSAGGAGFPRDFGVIDYLWSPDERYLLAEAGPSLTPNSDDISGLSVGIVSPDGSGGWRPLDWMDFETFQSARWRPAITPP